MPSERVWLLLTRGPHEAEVLEPWTVFQSVLNGLANAGWNRVHAERALHDWQGQGTPGQWWLTDRRGRPREFDRAWLKATTRVKRFPADPRLGRSADPRHDEDARALLNALEHRITHDGFLPAGHRSLSVGKHAAEERITLYAMVALARQHISALPLTEDRDGIFLAAAARSLALLTNSAQPRVSRRLRSLHGAGADGGAPHHSMVSLATRGRPGDAFTYLLRPGRQGAPCSQVSSLRERSMNNVVVARPVAAPDPEVLRHDAFSTDIPSGFPGAPRRPGLGQPAALITALLASNPDGIAPTVLSAITGCPESSVATTLEMLLDHGRTSDLAGPVLIEVDAGRASIAATHVDALLDDLDVWAEAMGRAGVSQARLAQVDEERHTYQQHPKRLDRGSPSRRSAISGTDTGDVVGVA